MPTFRDYHFHLPTYHVDHDRDLKLLFGSHLVLTILSGLVFFFFPLFLFQFSQSILLDFLMTYSPLQQGLIVIAFYFAFMRVITLITAVPIARLISSQGVRFSLLLAHVLFILKLVLLTQVAVYPWLIVGIAFFHGIFINAYWIAYHFMLTQKTHLTNVGKDLGLVQFLMELGKMSTPALGGLIVVTSGYPTLFIMGIVLLLISMIFVIMLKNTRVPQDITYTEVVYLTKAPTFSRNILTFGGRYINDAIITLWPLYVFLFLGAVDKVGYLYSISLLVALLISLVVGMYIDKAKTKFGFYLSGGTLGIIWLSRMFAITPFTLALTDTFDRLAASVTWLFYDSLLYKGAKGKYALLLFTSREVVVSIWGILLWSLIGIIFLVSNSAWNALFTIGAIGVILSLFMTDTQRYGKDQK